MVMKPMPKNVEDIERLADQMYTGMVKRETEAVEKMRQVIEFATDDNCRCSMRSCIGLLGLNDVHLQVWRKVWPRTSGTKTPSRVACVASAASAQAALAWSFRPLRRASLTLPVSRRSSTHALSETTPGYSLVWRSVSHLPG